MAILNADSFKGTGGCSIPQDSHSNLASYITEFEKFYLLHLLGVELYKLFIADLTVSTPQTPQALRYQNIFNEILYDSDGCLDNSRGMKNMLKGFIYFHYMRTEVVTEKTKSAVVKAKSENSDNAGYQFNLEEEYNKSVSDFKAIQSFINRNISDYPTFNPHSIDYTSGI